MTELKRVYNVPLRKEWSKAPRWNKAKKAASALRAFAAKHMKVEFTNVKLGRHVNMKLWSRGIRHPPHHVKVEIIKNDDRVTVELKGKKYYSPSDSGYEKEIKERIKGWEERKKGEK